MSMGETRPGGEKIEWNFFAVALGSVQVVPSWGLGCPWVCPNPAHGVSKFFGVLG